MKEYFALQLLHKQFTGELENQDKILLQDWIAQSVDNKAFSETVQKIWELSANYSPSVNFEAGKDKALHKFREAIQSEKEIPQETIQVIQRPEAITRTMNPWKWIAGAAAAIAVTAVAIIGLRNDGNSYDSLATMSTIEGQIEKVELIDNSQFWVNEKSTVQFFENKNENQRSVVLQGEAFFDVQPSSKPFVIETENATITVLGTEFNVESDKTKTQVQVKEGEVELRPKNSTKSIILTANMTGIYDAVNKRLYRKQSKSYNGDSWRTGGFSFEDASIEEVFETLENHYNVDIYLKNQELETCVFTSPVYQDNNIEEVLDVMQLIYGFTYEKEDSGRFVIEGGKCRK